MNSAGAAARVFSVRCAGAALAAALATTGCASAPTTSAPKLALDPSFVNAGAAAANCAGARHADIATFWRGFGDADADRR